MKAFALFENGTACEVVATRYEEDQERIKATILGQTNMTVKDSAQRGAGAAYNVLRDLRQIRKPDRFFVSFEFVGNGVGNCVLGSSATLLFGVKFAGDLIEQQSKKSFAFAIAVTGDVSDHTATAQVEGIKGIALKLAAALEVLGWGDKFVYPKANDREIDIEFRERAAEKGVYLVPVETVEEALIKVLGIRPPDFDWWKAVCAALAFLLLGFV